eukprot:362478-Chlamydomonas_euryale.AAC.7
MRPVAAPRDLSDRLRIREAPTPCGRLDANVGTRRGVARPSRPWQGPMAGRVRTRAARCLRLMPAWPLVRTQVRAQQSKTGRNRIPRRRRRPGREIRARWHERSSRPPWAGRPTTWLAGQLVG